MSVLLRVPKVWGDAQAAWRGLLCILFLWKREVPPDPIGPVLNIDLLQEAVMR